MVVLHEVPVHVGVLNPVNSGSGVQLEHDPASTREASLVTASGGPCRSDGVLLAPLVARHDPGAHVALHHAQGGVAKLSVDGHHRVSQNRDVVVANVSV